MPALRAGYAVKSGNAALVIQPADIARATRSIFTERVS
jgi:hypothetical protein